MRYNEFNQPIGDALPDYHVGERPSITTLEGDSVIIEKLSMQHADDLYEAYTNSPLSMWTYLSVEPFENRADFDAYLQAHCQSSDPYHLTIIDKESKKAVGTFSLMRIDPANRAIEMGWVVFSSALQQTRQSTEAQYLVMKYAFEELGYRRYEWKCDHLNQPSRNAALRLGFTFEGTFRQAVVYKGRNRDTDWFSILDSEWPTNKKRLENWLSPDNFDENGRQKMRLTDF